MPSMHLLISGRVQGVGFRWFVRVAARQLDLGGWVRNREDGAVELAASGPQEKLDELRRQVSRGPSAAEVTDVKSLEPVESELDFPFAMRR
jgi:acylphosphatase